MNRSLFARVLAPCLMMASLAVTPATAQISKLKEAVKAEVERGTISPEAAKAIRAEISPVPTNERGVSLLDVEWDVDFSISPAPNGELWNRFEFRQIEADVEGNIVARGIATTTPSNTIYSFVSKHDSDSGGAIWALEPDDPTGYSSLTVDINGNVYVMLKGTTGSPIAGRAFITKIDGESGFQQWQREIPDLLFPETRATLAVDQDGGVYAIYKAAENSSRPNALIVRRYRPDGFLVYDKQVAAGPVQFQGNAEVVEVDRFGNLFIVYQASGALGRVIKVSPFGDVEWRNEVDFRLANSIAVDVDCNTYVVQLETNGATAYRLTSYESNGDLRFVREVLTDGIAVNLKVVVTRDNQAYVGYDTRATGSNEQPAVDQFFPEFGQFVARRALNFGLQQFEIVTFVDLGVDRFGNPYVMGGLGLSNQLRPYIVKLNKRDLPGASVFDVLPAGSAGGRNDPTDMVIDFGDNIFIAGLWDNDPDGPGGALPELEFARLTRYSQPFTSVPTIVRNSPRIEVQNQSIWTAGQGSVTEGVTFFDQNIPLGLDIQATSSIPVLGDFGGRVTSTGFGRFGAGFEATASGGTADIDYPGELDIAVAGIDKLEPGAPFPIRIQFDPDPSASVTADITPEVGAGLTGNAAFDLNANASLIAFSDEFASFNILDEDAGFDGFIPGLSFQIPTGEPGSWVEIADEANFFSAKLTRPQFATSGGVNAQNGRAVSTLEPEIFLELRANITNILSTAAGFPTVYGVGAPSPATSEWSFGAGVSLVQLFTQVDLEANQTIQYEPKPEVVLNFSIPVDIRFGPAGVTEHRVVLDRRDGSSWFQDVVITASPAALQANNYLLTVIPTLEAPGEMTNRTWINVLPTIGWETLGFAANAQGFGETLFGFEACLGCFDVQPFTFEIPLFENTFDVPAFPEPGQKSETPTFMLDPIQIVIEPDPAADPAYPGQPRISGTSRQELKAYIYNQTAPSVQSFDSFLSEDPKRMLIYGDLFNAKGQYEIENFVLCVGGRIFDLPLINAQNPGEPLNSRTALVEIPNEARLVPAVARIWAEDVNGMPVSDSVDFPITLPRPNLAAAGPSIWANDPRVGENLEINVDDGLTSLGEPSFIARLDYWTVLNDLWGQSSQTTGNFFSLYPLYDFSIEPPLPAVMITRDDLAVAQGRISHFTFDGTLDNELGSATFTGNTPPEYTAQALPSFLDRSLVMDTFGNEYTQVETPSLAEPGTGDFSLSIWLKFDGEVTTPGPYFTTKEAGLNGIELVRGPGGPALDMRGDSIGRRYQASSSVPSTNFRPRTWHNIIVTVDRDATDGGNFYFDGLFDGMFDPTELIDADIRTNTVRFGATHNTNGSGNGSFRGQIGDLQIYDRVLTLDEILALSDFTEATPISRLAQSQKNGQLFATLPVGEYDEPDVKGVILRTAGPGGGESDRANLTVAAPRPLVSNLEPRSVIPGSGDLVLTVEGPFNVPTFVGFEQERFGNFNKASVVLWNGMELDTKYVTPGTLRAIVPAELTSFQGSAQVSVYTPSNGTQYFDGFAGGQGEPGFNVDSGGESNSIGFDIRYPQPVIMALQPEYATRALINRCADVPGEIRLQVTGRHIVPGAVIWFNGAPLETFVQANKANGIFINGVKEEALSDDVIFAFLGVDDLEPALEAAGVATITVVNPDGSASETALLDIVDQATYEMLSGVTLPEQTLPGEPCDD